MNRKLSLSNPQMFNRVSVRSSDWKKRDKDSYNTTSLMECGALCQMKEDSCNAFHWDQENMECTLGYVSTNVWR